MDYQEINKQNIGKWEDTLKYLTHELDSNNIQYYLSASGLHYIQGSNIYPYDIDLFISKDDIEKTFSIFKKYTISNIHTWEKRYLEFQGIYNDIPFEICEWEEKTKKIKSFLFKGFNINLIDEG